MTKHDNAISAACADERERVNRAIDHGKVITIKCLGNPHILDGVTSEWWYITHPEPSRLQ